MNNSQDAFYTTVSRVLPHPNADRLDIVAVKGFQCAVLKGSVVAGDPVLYIAPDARLDPEKPWAKDLLQYLGRGYRVKTVKLRGVFSEGIVISQDKLKDVNGDLPSIKELGISHWEMPSPPCGKGNLEARSSRLPYGLKPTDQENAQRMDPCQILGKSYMITRKKDGSSCTLVWELDEKGNLVEFHITSRNIDLKPEAENIYSRAAKSVVEHVSKPDILMRLATKGTKYLVLRGEVCGAGINASAVNEDAEGEPTFFIFEAYIVRHLSSNEVSKPSHFSLLALPEMLEFFQFNIVPVIGTVTALTQGMIDDFLGAPAKAYGEGVVLWEIDPETKRPTGFSFKIKSRDYYSKL